jgi:hypothetical protein
MMKNYRLWARQFRVKGNAMTMVEAVFIGMGIIALGALGTLVLALWTQSFLNRVGVCLSSGNAS